MMRFSNIFLQIFVIICVVVAISFVTVYSSGLFYFNPPTGTLNPQTDTQLTRLCNWQEGDAVIYHLKTKLGVTYDAGHWFHMSENFMAQHSKLRERNLLSNTSNIIYSFDKGKRRVCLHHIKIIELLL